MTHYMFSVYQYVKQNCCGGRVVEWCKSVGGESEAIADLPRRAMISSHFRQLVCSVFLPPSLLLFYSAYRSFHSQFMMRPQSLYLSLGLLQRVPIRSFVPTGVGRRAISSSSRVPDFAFAFEYVIHFLHVVSRSSNNVCLVSMASSYDRQSPSPAPQTR